MRRVCLPFAVVLVVVLSWAPSGASGQACAGYTNTLTLTDEAARGVAVFQRATIFQMSCFKYTVTPVDNALPECATLPTVSAVLRVQEDGDMTQMLPITHTFDGSYRLAQLNFKRASDVALFIQSTEAASCPVIVQVTYSSHVVFISVSRPLSENVPFLHHASTALIEQKKSVTLVFSRPTAVPEGLRQDRIAFVGYSLSQRCSALNMGTFPTSYATTADGEHQFSLEYQFYNTGLYRVCVQPAGSASSSPQPFHEVAVLQVYGGNPSYFTIDDGATGRAVQINKEHVLRFYGDALDLRRGHDSAKLVESYRTCYYPAAADVDTAEDLGPSDASGVSVAAWTITIRRPGAYRICYRRYEAQWVEVPLLNSLPSAAREKYEFDPAATSVATAVPIEATLPATAVVPPPSVTVMPPAPTTAATCTTSADFTYDASVARADSVTLTLRPAEPQDMPTRDQLRRTIATFLCLDVALVDIGEIDGQEHNDEHQQPPPRGGAPAEHQVVVTVRCCFDECDNHERLAYLVWGVGRSDTAVARALAVAGITEAAQQENSVVQAADDDDNEPFGPLARKLMIGFGAAAIGVMAILTIAFCVRHHRRTAIVLAPVVPYINGAEIEEGTVVDMKPQPKVSNLELDKVEPATMDE